MMTATYSPEDNKCRLSSTGRLETWEQLPAGTFAGTGVRAVLLTITHKPAAPSEIAEALRGEADREYQTRLEAERCTLEFATAMPRNIDAGRRPIADSPMFGGPRQFGLFEDCKP